jgi:ESCRT-II complex subunit VPS36
MNVLKWSTGRVDLPNEEQVYEQNATTIYLNEEKTGFQKGKLRLTTHRLFWHDIHDAYCVIELRLFAISNVELKQVQVTTSKGKQNFTRLFVHLEKLENVPTELLNPFLKLNSVDSSKNYANAFFQFEFEYGGHLEFYQQLNQLLIRKKWLDSLKPNTFGAVTGAHNIGIVGIQRRIQDRLDMQDQTIQNSFRDLSNLMNQAKDMINLSNLLVAKISKDKLAASNEAGSEDDEDMRKLKSYFMNMGIIDNPVSRETSGSKYYKDLAMEIYKNMSKLVEQQGGIMTLPEIFCRLNRARSMAGLISPEDLLNACKQLNKLDTKLKYKIYDESNLHVLEIETTDSDNNLILKQTCDLVEKNEYLTPYMLSNLIKCNLIVAKKHLTDAERTGRLCRDMTNMGLRFYKNLFLC